MESVEPMRNASKVLMFAVLLAACEGGEQATPTADTVAAADTHAAHGAGGMVMPSGAMMEQMRSRLRAEERISGDSLRASLPAHRQQAANLVAQLNKEMRDMNMAADAAWQALTDSVRQDLARLPDVGAAELGQVMPGHRARLDRLMTMHETMMRGM